MIEASPATGATQQSNGEFALLCALAAIELGTERRERIANWRFSDVDWNRFLSLAEHHGLLPLAARNLLEMEAAADLPPEVERALRSGFEANLKHSLWLTAEMARLLRHFEMRQVRSLAYKGPVLGQSVYHDVALRNFSDLDFLIPRGEFERAKQALGEMGYRASENLDPAVERFWLRNGNERGFSSSAGNNLVELQWALVPYFYSVELPVEELLGRAGRIVVCGWDAPCLSPEDSLLVLCLHAGKHIWTRLLWLVDIAETLRSQTIEYKVVFSRARALGITRILGVSFWLVKNVLGEELPRLANEMMEADPRVAMLGREFAARLARGATYDFETKEYFLLTLKLRDRFSDRCRYLWRLIWTPGAGDLAAVKLPEALFPIYRILRLGRLLKKIF